MAGTSKIDNIIIGNTLVDPQLLGVSKTETTIHLSFSDARNEQGNMFLPVILKQVGIFKSTNEIKQVNSQRKSKIEEDPLQDLWRNIEEPEFTEFKIGKKLFWLLVGEDDVQIASD